MNFDRETSLQDELRTLEKADRDIDAGNRLIREQAKLMEQIERDGQDPLLALQLLMTLKASLQAMVEHRTLILERIEHLRRERG